MATKAKDKALSKSECGEIIRSLYGSGQINHDLMLILCHACDIDRITFNRSSE